MRYTQYAPLLGSSELGVMEDIYKEGARRVTEISVKMCTDRRRSNRQETTNAVDSKHRACL